MIVQRDNFFLLELAKKSPECLEYIVVQEMLHLIVRPHDDRFTRALWTAICQDGGRYGRR
jgi:predicted metal-dependent hydrolase